MSFPTDASYEQWRSNSIRKTLSSFIIVESIPTWKSVLVCSWYFKMLVASCIGK